MNATAAINVSTASTFDPHLANAWRINCQEVAESIRFVKQYRKTIDERNERLSSGHLVHSPAYVENCEKLLPWRLSLYLEHVRAVSECERRMDMIGMAYALSSDDWRS